MVTSVHSDIIEKGGPAILTTSVKTNFEPKEAYFYLSSVQGETKKYNAYLLPYARPGRVAQHEKRWLCGLPVALQPGTEALSFIVVVHGPEGQLVVSDVEQYGTQSIARSSFSVEQLRESIVVQRKAVRTIEGDLETMERNYQRLRSDAEMIGSLGVLIAQREEVIKAKDQISRLQEDVADLNSFLTGVSSSTKPKNYERRQRDLTQQLAELAQVARGTELSESHRRRKNESQKAEIEALIKETRNVSLSKLKRDYQNLVKERKLLEGSLGFDEGEIDEYDIY